ncbi:MAG: hypothetical protein R2698_07600 [Microthrixaceae bacterium]
MIFAVDSWNPDYGTSVDGGELEDAHDDVDCDVELPASQWRPLTPRPASVPDRVAFVDGVRRVDARVWITDGATARAGVCASIAAGAVVATRGSARLADAEVRRILVAPAQAATADIATGHGTYVCTPSRSEAAEDLYHAIHSAMTGLEVDLVLDDVGTVVYDGPLRGRSDPRGVGFVKTHNVRYLPVELETVQTGLAAGQRTPLFLIGSRGFVRWSWYLRLVGPVTHPLAGIVRLELDGRGTTAERTADADALSWMLQRFASHPHKDSRAPQNLYPIAGLERELRHRLGDRAVLERGLRRAATTGAEDPSPAGT